MTQRHGNAHSIGRLIAREMRLVGIAPYKRSCPKCDGLNTGVQDTVCKRCKGAGFVPSKTDPLAGGSEPA